MRLNEITEDLITMWHGGRELQYSYREMRGNKSKQMEYGPGLYLTTYYSTASKYAKGGGKTYLVTFARGNEISEITLVLTEVISFLKSHRFQRKAELIKYIEGKYPTGIPALHMLNLMINFESITPTTSVAVRQFLVDQGVDYHVSHNYGGFGDQTIVVIFDPSIIKSVVSMAASEVTPDMYKLPVAL